MNFDCRTEDVTLTFLIFKWATPVLFPIKDKAVPLQA